MQEREAHPDIFGWVESVQKIASRLDGFLREYRQLTSLTKGINIVTGMTAIMQRVLASLFVVLAIVNVLIAIVVVGQADSGVGYLIYGLGGLLWIVAGLGYLLAATGVMKLDGTWRVIALVAAGMSAFLSAFAMPALFAHLLLDGAVIVGVLRWSLMRPAPARGR